MITRASASVEAVLLCGCLLGYAGTWGCGDRTVNVTLLRRRLTDAQSAQKSVQATDYIERPGPTDFDNAAITARNRYCNRPLLPAKQLPLGLRPLIEKNMNKLSALSVRTH